MVVSKAAHTVGTLDRPAKQDLGNRARFAVAVDQDAENPTRGQRVDENAIVEDRNTVEDPARGAEGTVSRPDLQLPTTLREAIDLHVIAVRNIRCTVRTNRNVIAESAGRRQRIACLERPGLQIESVQSGGRLRRSVV